MNGTANNQEKLSSTSKLCTVTMPQTEATRILGSGGGTLRFIWGWELLSDLDRTHQLCLNPWIHKQLILELGTEHKAPHACKALPLSYSCSLITTCAKQCKSYRRIQTDQFTEDWHQKEEPLPCRIHPLSLCHRKRTNFLIWTQHHRNTSYEIHQVWEIQLLKSAVTDRPREQSAIRKNPTSGSKSSANPKINCMAQMGMAGLQDGSVGMREPYLTILSLFSET